MPTVRTTLRGVAVATSSALLVAAAPLTGPASASTALTLVSTSPAHGTSTNDEVKVVSATYSEDLAQTSTLEVKLGTTPVACVSTVSGDTISCASAVALPDGAYTATAAARSATSDATRSDDFAFTVDTRAPAAPTVSASPSRTKGTLVVSGSAESGGDLALTVTDSEGASWQSTSTVPGSGEYRFSDVDVSGLADGRLTVAVAVTDQAGNESPKGTATATKDTKGPVLQDSSPDGPAHPGTDAAPTPVSAVFDEALDPASSTISVTKVGNANPRSGTTTFSDDAETITFVPSPSKLADGDYVAAVRAQDVLGHVTSVSFPFTLDSQVPKVPTASFTHTHVNADTVRAAKVTGQAEPLSRVTVTVVDSLAQPRQGTVEADSLGEYSWAPPWKDIADGRVDADAVAVDAAGNRSEKSERATTEKDLMPPRAPSLTDVPPSTDATTPVAIKGRLDPVDVPGREALTATVTLTDADATSLVATTTTFDASTGQFTASFPAASVASLAEGVLSAAARVQDRAGNVGPASASRTMSKDAADLAYVKSTPSKDSTVRPPSRIDVVFSEPLQKDKDGKPASTIALSDVDGPLACTREFPDPRTISCTPPAELSEAGNVYTVTIDAVDTVGDAVQETIRFTVDSTPPPAPAVTDPVHDVTTASPLAVVVSGAGLEPSDTVSVLVRDRAGTTASADAARGDGGDHHAEVDVTGLADGVLTVTATATDALGNRSAPGQSRSTTKDVKAPRVTTTGPPSVTRSNGASFTFTGVDPDRPEAVLRYECKLDGPDFEPCTSPASYTDLADGAHTFDVVAVDEAGHRSPTATRTWTVDTVAPTVTAAAVSVFTLASRVGLRYTGADGAGSGVRNYDVRHRSAPHNGTFGSYVYPNDSTLDWTRTTSTSVTLPGTKGRTYCLSVRSRDTAGNVSPWSPERCTGVALDDRALTRSAGWVLGTHTAYYDGTVTTARTVGSSLTATKISARRLAVIASRCPGCGAIGVYWNGVLIRTVSLDAATTKHRQIISVATFARTQTGTLTIKATKAALTRIDGIGVNRT